MSKYQTRQTVETLWSELLNALDKSYDEAHECNDSERAVSLQSYTTGYSNRDLHKLVASETANEREHRTAVLNTSLPFAATDKPALPVTLAAKLLICENIARGAGRDSMPAATIFLHWRKSAAEAYTLGYLLRGHLSADWLRVAGALDYAQAMKGR